MPSRVVRCLALSAVVVVAVTLAPSAVVAEPSEATTAAQVTSNDALPVVTPTPQSIERNGRPVAVPKRVGVLFGSTVDTATRELVRTTLRDAGARQLVQRPAGLTVVVGRITEVPVRAALRLAGGERPKQLRAEGYSLAARGRLVALAGNDGDGVYYAAQTLRQLASPGRIAAARVVDYPLMEFRGSIEGFYGGPWSRADRLDQLAFYGDIKANNYIYTPKDDVYLRERWRDQYPRAELAKLKELVDAAKRHHVEFTYAISPGLSICYSDPADVASLREKFASLYAQGVRSFYIALDDISYTKWNCAGDEQKYGPPGQAAAGQAQTDLLNTIQRDYLDTVDGAQPLQMVPTEYSDVADSPYKKVLRENLDERVVIQWTGTDVVPPSISVADAEKAATVWGRKVFLWDNYPVNDYDKTTGRLLMAPYDKREAGLHTALNGIVLNPMNQAAPSKVALFGGAAFAWNDEDYDAARTWRAAADYLADGDRRVSEALLAFFDTQHLAPTFGEVAWQPQAPTLKSKVDAVRAKPSGKPLRELGEYAQLLAAAPERIRAGVADSGFTAQSKPWLDALDLWGDALRATVRGLGTQQDAAAERQFARAAELAERASAIETIPGTTRPQGTIRVADGVLDTFIADAPGLRRG